jgi:hypothetical protein
MLLACADPLLPYVRYQGTNFGRKRSVDDIEVLRTARPSGRFQDIGTVIVVCPSRARGDNFANTAYAEGGCNYEGAVNLACIRAASNGADGIHSLEVSTNVAGNVTNLRASAFVRLPALAKPAPPATAEPPPPAAAAPEAKPNVEDRLRQLDGLRDKGLVTPEEYASKRKAILDEI